MSEIRTLGLATIHHGDALEVLPSLSGSFGGIIADPPYSSGGAVRDRAMAPSAKYLSSSSRDLYPEFEGESRDQRSYLAWSMLWMSQARRLMAPGGIIAVFSDWRQLPTTTDALQAAGWVWRGVVPWDKTEACRPQLGRYRNQTEFVVWGTNGPRPLVGPTAPGVVRARVPREKHHIAGKPVELMTQLLTPIDGAILDPFMGSGTVGVAALEKGVRYVGIEVTAAYFEIATARLVAAA